MFIYQKINEIILAAKGKNEYEFDPLEVKTSHGHDVQLHDDCCPSALHMRGSRQLLIWEVFRGIILFAQGVDPGMWQIYSNIRV